MRKILAALLFVSTCLQPVSADIFDLFRRSKPPKAQDELGGLSEDQITRGLKEALSKGAQEAVATLGEPGGFLQNSQVKIPMPENLKRVEATLRTLRQDKLADEFVTTMNRAAEEAVPQAGAVLGEAIQEMSVADAKAILTGTNTAATAYFRRVTETNLFNRFRPIVEKATEEAGVTRAYKAMAGRAGGGFASSLLSKDENDIDGYITGKALDGLFFKIAEQERRIRENPVARTSDRLRQVFGAVDLRK